MWVIGVEVEQETSAPPPEKNPGSAPESRYNYKTGNQATYVELLDISSLRKHQFLLALRHWGRRNGCFRRLRHISFILSRCKACYLSELIYAGPDDSRDTS